MNYNHNIPWNSVLSIAGGTALAAYIFWGGTFESKKNKYKQFTNKDSIPGLFNIGNTCFLNSILQSLASCPSFLKWLKMNTKNLPLVLLNSLERITNDLNEPGHPTCSAEDVLYALKHHRWVISSEEQDAHELFHALTSTIDEEASVIRRKAASLFDVSWINNLQECKSFHKTVNYNNYFNSGKIVKSSVVLNSKLQMQDNSESEKVDISSIEPFFANRSANGKNSVISKIPSVHDEFGPSVMYMESPFKGHFINQLQCNICGFKTADKWSSFESLSVALPEISTPSCTLQDLLKAFVQPEAVGGVECEGCSKVLGSTARSPFSKRLSIGKLPQCLCIHIRRTVWLNNGCPIKRKDSVSFPEVINMAPYTFSVTPDQKQALKAGLFGGRAVSTFNERLDQTEQNGDVVESVSLPNDTLLSQRLSNIEVGSWQPRCLYRVRSVVVHVGDAFSGHFVTYRRGPSATHIQDKWFYTSDTIVREVPFHEVSQSHAYMLMYERLAI